MEIGSIYNNYFRIKLLVDGPEGNGQKLRPNMKVQSNHTILHYG